MPRTRDRSDEFRNQKNPRKKSEKTLRKCKEEKDNEKERKKIRDENDNQSKFRPLVRIVTGAVYEPIRRGPNLTVAINLTAVAVGANAADG